MQQNSVTEFKNVFLDEHKKMHHLLVYTPESQQILWRRMLKGIYEFPSVFESLYFPEQIPWISEKNQQ